MAWTAPYTWVSELVTVAKFNEQIRDNLLALTTWNTRAFSAGNYTGNGSMTWTLASGDVQDEAYVLAGDVMIVAFDLTTTTVGGTPNTALQITLPESATCSHNCMGVILYSDNGGALTMGYCSADASGTTINCFLIGGGNWTASTDATSVRGTIVVPV